MFDNNAEPDVVFLTCVATEDKFPLIQDQLNNLRIEWGIKLKIEI